MADIMGTTSSEFIPGTIDNDTINGAGGSDTIDGGAGTDTAVFFGNRNDFTITILSGIVRLTGLGTAPYPYTNTTVQLLNVEKVQFADSTTLLPISTSTFPDLKGSIWDLGGIDRRGNLLDGELVFETQILTESNANLEGYFDWMWNGIKPFRINFDAELEIDGTLKFTSTALLVAVDGIVAAQYEGTFSQNYQTLTGTWFGNGTIPGTWSAIPIEEPAPGSLLKAVELFQKEGMTDGDEGGNDAEDKYIGAIEAGKIKVMADFSKAAYSLQDWEKVGDNALINDEKNADPAINDLKNKGWQPINLAPTLTSPDNNIYAAAYFGLDVINQMVNGFYTNGNAAAFVARSADALVISFRGTNDGDNYPLLTSPDEGDWSNKSRHYDLMRPLVEAVENYIVTQGIHKVYVTGHSLGGAMAIKFMNDHENGSFGANYEAVTFAAPSYDLLFQTYDDRMTLIEIEGDITPDAGIANNGNNIHFVGNETNDLSFFERFGKNHSMDYHRQMVDSVDNVAWDQILKALALENNQHVYIGGRMVGEDYIVDGRQSGTNLPNGHGFDTLLDLNHNYDIFYGGRGGDILVGGSGNELMLGGSGDDALNGLGGADTLIGGLGNDKYFVDNINDVITENVNQGADDVSSAITYTLSANVENLVLTGTSPINGTGNDLANMITGNIVANQLNGGLGNDTLDGGAANDNLNGGAGDDTLIGWSGVDTMVGGLDNDSYFVENAGDIVTENLNEGTDTISSRVTYTLPTNVENLTLTGTSVITGTGNDLNNVITGNNADNQLNGQAGNDMLNGGGGNDTLTGWSGADIMTGGSGNDTYFVENVGDVVTETLSQGTDIVSSRLTYNLPVNVENLTLTGTSAINGTGNGLTNVITGNAAINILSGAAGNDRLFGKGGNDMLTGGSGVDKFVFDTVVSATNIDTITDFLSGTDKILLNDDIFTTLGIVGTIAGVALTADKFYIGVSAQDAFDRIVYNSSTGALKYDADGSGAGAAVQVALIGTSTHPTLAASDFLVIA